MSFSAELRALFEHSLDAILLTAPEGRILAANPAACRVLGRTEAEICRLGRGALLDASDPTLAGAIEERARTGRFFGELTFLRADGSRMPAEVSSVIYASDDGAQHAFVVFRDIAERKAAEQRHVRDEQIAALRQLAIGIRHEMNNALAALTLELTLADDAALSTAERARCISGAQAQVQRLVATLRRLDRVEELQTVSYLGGTLMLDVSTDL